MPTKMSTEELVRHLRASAKIWPIGGTNSLTELLDQAADEIERLRRELTDAYFEATDEG